MIMNEVMVILVATVIFLFHMLKKKAKLHIKLQTLAHSRNSCTSVGTLRD